MNILVTGGAGFVGTNLIERLIEEGHSVTSVDDYSTGHKENHIQGCKYIEMSVVDFDRYHDLEFSEFDLIYHLEILFDQIHRKANIITSSTAGIGSS